ncbi:MAG: tRNA uridine-5-carboxymethylaminomethyl(34) synthesis GTPase MnmE [Gemmatimonadaceae bacterium]|nr:tRNA uridine-5-carboxymethylaminomethyl(34) synthesis GTPase MnmE [Gemmatimonadaceae bacterium]
MSDGKLRHPARPAGKSRAPGVRGDTIVAIATAPGRGAVAIVRLSGPDAERIGRGMVTPWPRTPRRLVRCALREPGERGRPLDDALAVFFPQGSSYTGEPTLELHIHGGMAGPSVIRDACVASGAREALPGEFTERAVLNGRMDLLEAEAIGALVDARTRAAHRAALSALSGTLSRLFRELREAAIGLDAMLAYDIDFPEEDGGPIHRDTIETAARSLAAKLDSVLAAVPAAPIARDGALVVLAGPPNAGKSSLLNALVGESRVIVSDQPGTTRDAVEVLVDEEPWPVRLVDTAGLRDEADAVERLGIEVSDRYLRAASVVLACADDTAELAHLTGELKLRTSAEVIGVRTKGDVGDRLSVQAGDTVLPVTVSAQTGAGLAVLWERIRAAVQRAAGSGVLPAAAAVTVRQHSALKAARREVATFLGAWRSQELPVVVCATHVRAAAHELDELIGSVSPDDVLARVFSSFCVGK